LNEIFEYLADDKFALYSCSLVNRLWCEIAVRILWRNVWNYSNSYFRTLISCLPNESKEILLKNGIVIPTPTPTFYYASFCKTLLVRQIFHKLELFLKTLQSISPENLKASTNIVGQEIFKMLTTQVTSLKQLEIFQFTTTNFISTFVAKDNLRNLSHLYCSSDISPEFFYQLAQICKKILLFDVTIEQDISDGLAEVISAQKNLVCFSIYMYYYNARILSLFEKLPRTLTKLNLYGGDNDTSLSFINNLTELQELQLEFEFNRCFKDFGTLQYTTSPQLQVLSINCVVPKCELLIKFLEKNGKYSKEIYLCEYKIDYSDNTLNLAIAKS
jgi:hypothetical protein